jgi:hypothetical protein
MPKFTLIAEHTNLYTGDVESKTTREFEVDYLPDVLENIDLFLRGTGFFFNGNLDIVNDFEEPPETEESSWNDHGGGSTMADYPELYPEKSKHYFDTQRNK